MIEIVNETVILICTYFCWLFTDFMEYVEVKEQIGWFYILMLGSMLLFNMSFMIYQGIYKSIRQKIKA